MNCLTICLWILGGSVYDFLNLINIYFDIEYQRWTSEVTSVKFYLKWHSRKKNAERLSTGRFLNKKTTLGFKTRFKATCSQ